MISKRRFDISARRLAISLALTAALGAATVLVVERVRAAGIPATGALTYTGYLETPAGAPVETPQNIGLEVFTTDTGVTSVCAKASAAITPIAGRFQIDLPDECTNAVKANPNLWVAVSVNGASLGRTKLGAVPYAVEAAHADSATSATNATNASGALDTRITAIENAALSKSAFYARHTTAQVISNGTAPTIIFDAEDLDKSNEYAPATGIFTPKTAGWYDLSCNLFFNGPGTTGYFEAAIFVNNVRIDVAGIYGRGDGLLLRARSMLKLAVGDAVTCRAYQGGTGSNIPLYNVRPGEAISTFSGARLFQ